MSYDYELLEEFKKELADKYDATELVELLRLDVWAILEAFHEEIMELHRR